MRKSSSNILRDGCERTAIGLGFGVALSGFEEHLRADEVPAAKACIELALADGP